jgi:hypothetical protein
VITDPDDTEQGESSSKKDIVKRKWNKFKNNVKRKSPQNPLNILRRRGSNASSSDESEYHTDLEEDQVEENAQLPVISNEGYYWVGKDYSNTYKADFKDIADFSSDQYDRAATPRMPWRDEALVVFGESARDLARHFIQRWNQCKVNTQFTRLTWL